MVDENLLSVDEAAERLEISVATVRRMCASGQLMARKVGRRWVLPEAELPRRRPSRRARGGGRATGFDLDTACRHVLGLDERELWVPDILRHEDVSSRRSEAIAAAASRLDGQDPFDSATPVEVPKSSFFTRTGQLLTFPDRVAFQAAVASVAPSIERRLSPSVYSSRLALRSKDFLRKSRDQWLLWRNDVVTEVLLGRSFVVRTDITSFFDAVKHDLLIPELQTLPNGPMAAPRIREMLRRWTDVPNVGLPQGPNASRVLGNFFLVPVDEAMAAEATVGYFRYMDDIRLTADSRADAIRALRRLERECRLRGLALSSQKTKLLRGAEAIADFQDDQLSRLQYSFDLGEGDVELSKELGSVLRHAVLGQDELHERRARFALWRLFRLRDGRSRKLVLDNLETLAPLGQIVAAYLRPWLSKQDVQRRLSEFIMDQDRNTSRYLSSWVLALMLDLQSGATPLQWLSYAQSIATDRNEPSWHRTLAMSVWAQDRSSSVVRLLRDVVFREHDPEVIRGALVALARIGRLDRDVTQHAAARFPQTVITTEYLRGRTDLPSLVLTGRRVSVR